jgi:hypothetical protein
MPCVAPAPAAVVFHVEDARRVVGPFQEGAEADEVHRLVLQHGAERDAARQVASGT